MKLPVETEQGSILWPEDGRETQSHDGPDHELAIYLLASGAPHDYVAKRAGFESLRSARAFARDEETRRAVAELVGERAKGVGKQALVRLERILATEHSDLRATVLAIRTGLEVSGDLRAAATAPAKTVRELTVAELTELISATRHELEARVSTPRVGRDADR